MKLVYKKLFEVFQHSKIKAFLTPCASVQEQKLQAADVERYAEMREMRDSTEKQLQSMDEMARRQKAEFEAETRQMRESLEADKKTLKEQFRLTRNLKS